MGGLLYKDFAAVKGKRLVLWLTVLTVAYIALRVLFPGTGELEGFMAENDKGEIVNVIDTFFLMGEFTIIWLGCFMINDLGAKIVQYDEKNRIRGYLAAMPFEKKTYVASKYIFIAIAAYIIFSLYMLWHVVSIAFMGPGYSLDLSYMIAGFCIPFMCCVLLITSLELPMFLLMGNGKAMMIKVGIIMFIGVLVLGFLLFGDLTLLENWDIGLVISWAEKHEFELILLSVLSPAITMAFYYVSYRIAAYFYVRKEGYDEY